MTRLILTISILGLAFLLVGLAWQAFSMRDSEPENILPATINRDCAPWDGSAFTISIPIQGGSLYISIFQLPNLQHPTIFEFPDETMTVGKTVLTLPFSPAAPVRGNVRLQRVEQERPVEGRFDLVTETGQQLKGEFIAEWGDDIIYCG